MTDKPNPVRALLFHAMHAYPNHPEKHTQTNCPLCAVRALLYAGKLAVMVECDLCDSTGKSDVMEANEIADCSQCHGTGTIWMPIK